MTNRIEAAAKEMLDDYADRISFGPEGCVDSRSAVEAWLIGGLRRHFVPFDKERMFLSVDNDEVAEEFAKANPHICQPRSAEQTAAFASGTRVCVDPAIREAYITDLESKIAALQQELRTAKASLIDANPLVFGKDGIIDWSQSLPAITKQFADKCEHLRCLFANELRRADAAEHVRDTALARVKELESKLEACREPLCRYKNGVS